MISKVIHTLIIASLCSGFLVFILISFKETIIRLAGASWNYYLWSIVFIPWLAVWIPVIPSVQNHANLRIYLDKIALKQALSEVHPHFFHSSNLVHLIWIAGMFLSFTYIFMQHFYFSRKLKINSRIPTVIERKLISALLSHQEKKWLEKIYLSHFISSPMTGHLINSKIYLPTVFFECYSVKEQQYVLRHEIIHCQRFDLLANAVMLVFNCINWFNPILFLSYEHFKNAQEIACDQQISRYLTSSEKKLYGLALLKVTVSQSTLLSSVNCLFTSGIQLKERFLALKFHGTNNNIFIGISILVLALLFSISGSQYDKYVTKLLTPRIKFFSQDTYPRSSMENLFRENVLMLPNNIQIWASDIVVTYKDEAHQKISKCSIDGPGIIRKNNKIIFFEYGTLDPNTLQFTGAIRH